MVNQTETEKVSPGQRLLDRLRETATPTGQAPIDGKRLANWLYGNDSIESRHRVTQILGNMEADGLLTKIKEGPGGKTSTIIGVQFTPKGLDKSNTYRWAKSSMYASSRKRPRAKSQGKPRAANKPMMNGSVPTEPVIESQLKNLPGSRAKRSTTRTKNLMEDFKRFRKLFVEIKESNPDANDFQLLNIAEKRFHERAPSGNYLYITGAKTTPYSRQSMKHFADGRLYALAGSKRIEKSLLQEPLTYEAPAPAVKSSSPVVPNSGTIVKELGAMFARLPSETTIRRVVKEELAGTNERLTKLEERPSKGANSGDLEKMMNDLILALYDGGNGGLKTALYKRFPWIHQSSRSN